MPENNDKLNNPEEWVDKYGDYLFGFAMSRVFHNELAEDFVQETFLSALQSRKNFKGNSSELTWLSSILKNKIIDHFRKAGTTREKQILDKNWEIRGEASPFQQEGPFKGHWKAGQVSTEWEIEKAIHSSEFQEILELCLAQLPPNWAAAFTLKIMEECKSEDICKDLKISSSNLWVILHRARLKIRECLEKKWINN